MDFSTNTPLTSSSSHHNLHRHLSTNSSTASSGRVRATPSQKPIAPFQIHRSASASALVAGGSSRGAGSGPSPIGSEPRSKKSTTTAPPVPDIPLFLRSTNSAGNSGFLNAPTGINSFSGSRPGSARLTIDTSLSNGFPAKQNRSVSDTSHLASNPFASSSNNHKSHADGRLGFGGGSHSHRDQDRHDLVPPEETAFRNSLVDNLLLDFDKLGQDFSCDPSFDKFINPNYNEPVEYEREDYYDYRDRDHDYSRSRLHSRQSHNRQRSGSNPTQYYRSYETQSPKQIHPEEEEEVFEHNGTLVYTADGRFITTPPQSRRGPPPPRQQPLPFDPYTDPAPTPRVSNRSRAREPETPRQPNHLQRRRSTKSNKSLRYTSNAMTEHSTLPSIPSEAPPSEPVVSPASKPTSKPGFFRRVFGGGGGTKTVPQPPPPPPPQTVDSEKPSDGVKRQASLPTNSTSAVNENVPPPRTPQLVTKKSSGFFRRRKKSVSEHEPVPALPTQMITHHNHEIENPHASPPSLQQNPYGSNSRPETAASRSQSRAQTSRHEREMSDASILPNVVTSSPNNRNPTSIQSRRPTIRSIESELPNRLLAKEPDPTPEKITTAANINIEDIAAGAPYTKDMYTPRKSEQKSPPNSSHTKKSRQYEGSFLRDDDSDSSNEVSTTNLVPDATIKELEKTKSLETQRTGSTGDVFYDALSTAGRNNSVISKTENNMPVVVLPHGDEDERRGSGDLNATPRPRKIMNVVEEEDEGEPSTEEKDAARKIYEGDEEFLPKSKAAAFLGEAGAPSARIRKAYMAMYDWTSMNILAAFRGLCERLVLKGETQQVDRIVSAVAKRWCECNFNHGFKSTDVVHTILYSILLVNTDLHMADIPASQKMTKSQFVKNTLATVRRGLAIDENDAPHNVARSQTPYEQDEDEPYQNSNLLSSSGAGGPTVSKRLSFIRGTAAVQRFFDDQSSENFANYSVDGNGTGGETGGPLINAPFLGNMRQWESAIEAILKEFYVSIRAVALPLHGVTTMVDKSPDSATVPGTLGVRELRRTNSTVSKAPSESSMSLRIERYGSFGASSSTTRLGSKWNMKNRSRPRLYPGSFAGSSRTSFDDRLWSPSASSTWSKYSLDKTATSMMSTDSLGSGFGQGDYMQSIGFANALSTAIIREETGTGAIPLDDGEQSIQATVLDDDVDELALYGAPWAKEGMLKHKHHLESTDKKAKNRGWVECFAVVEKGWMRLFQFHNDKKKVTQGIVGGGNWMQNAEPIGSFMLRQTIASALPPPGYSRSRPHVFALSLPNGAVHFFQCGTVDIVKEWVGTANYWSARLSKEPLVGGVSNIEYGWSNCIDLDAFAQTQSPPSTSNAPRPSFQGSMRSSIDHGGFRARLPGDKAVIADWSPPAQSMFASPLNEGDQLKALESYVSNIEGELQKHNELRGPMLLAFTPRHPNYTKAMNNWERKSSYLLREIVKFRTYIDALSTAATARERIHVEKEQRANELAVEKAKAIETSTSTISPPDTTTI
ncbi:hypothetical protein ABW19_dt0203015 [Dactylella cylindrospora]|nr:hypothetical protein ABW19_dt0203015 [Dactylella cylindrospora]